MVQDKMNARGNKWMLYLIAVIPFLLNDFYWVRGPAYGRWVLADYACRVGVLAFLAVPVGRGRLTRGDLFLSLEGKARLAYWTLLLGGMAVAWRLAGGTLFGSLDGVWALPGVAYDRESALFALDMTLGLGLVAVSEELVFRGLALSALGTFTRSPAIILPVSALVFALAHWSTGLGNILDCFVFGLLFMGVTMRTRSVIPAMVVHYGLDFFLFVRA